MARSLKKGPFVDAHVMKKTIEAKAIRFVGNSYREAMLVARRKGAIGEPLLVISKTSISIVYYPSAELYEMAVEIHERAQAIRCWPWNQVAQSWRRRDRPSTEAWEPSRDATNPKWSLPTTACFPLGQ